MKSSSARRAPALALLVAACAPPAAIATAPIEPHVVAQPPPVASASAEPTPRATHAGRMPSGSMIPTIFVGESFVGEDLEANDDVRLGEAVVFASPERPTTSYVKRVLVFGEATVEFDDGHPSVNGWRVPSCVVGEFAYTEDDGDPNTMRHSGTLEVEFLSGRAYLVFFERGGGPWPSHQGPYRVPRGEAFVVGDNRMNSHDSRMFHGGAGGGVPRAMIRRRVRLAEPAMPRGADAAMQSKIDACLRARPAKTEPPARSSTPPTSP
jgi:signal peptidase I